MSYIDRHQFYVYSNIQETMTNSQASSAGYSDSDKVLLDANDDSSITFIEFAAFITAERDWNVATEGNAIL